MTKPVGQGARAPIVKTVQIEGDGEREKDSSRRTHHSILSSCTYKRVKVETRILLAAVSSTVGGGEDRIPCQNQTGVVHRGKYSYWKMVFGMTETVRQAQHCKFLD